MTTPRGRAEPMLRDTRTKKGPRDQIQYPSPAPDERLERMQLGKSLRCTKYWYKHLTRGPTQPKAGPLGTSSRLLSPSGLGSRPGHFDEPPGRLAARQWVGERWWWQQIKKYRRGTGRQHGWQRPSQNRITHRKHGGERWLAGLRGERGVHFRCGSETRSMHAAGGRDLSLLYALSIPLMLDAVAIPAAGMSQGQ